MTKVMSKELQDRMVTARLANDNHDTKLKTTSINNNNNLENISISENMQNDSNNNVNSTKINLPDEICGVGERKLLQDASNNTNINNNNQHSSEGSNAGDSSLAKFRLVAI